MQRSLADRLSVFEGGSPITISPDGRTVATSTWGGQPALWNVTRPRYPARLAVLSAGLPGALWGEAFSPDGRVLAAASTSGLALWDVADPARPACCASWPPPRSCQTIRARCRSAWARTTSPSPQAGTCWPA
jgi:WD40 repeat protein